MSTPKISCFHYKKYNDIYVNNIRFSVDKLLLVLGIFPDNKKVVVLIESGIEYIQALLSICKSIGITTSMLYLQDSVLLICKKTELFCLLKQINLDDVDGLFVTNPENESTYISDELINTIKYKVCTIVRDGFSDISISINFAENEMVISLQKKKFITETVQETISSILQKD